ncbi:MAG: septal ring lytic transglycosylase RlpA family protein [Actinomycetota bacterium]|nr:septal ring lytic transglycosylase RlpA family protein [Actinomycetota bacterium]
MNPPVVMRALVLAAVALLATVATLAIRDARNADAQANEPAPVAWYTARAAPYPPSTKARTACGQVLDGKTSGVAHPLLPCGVKVFLRFRGREVLTQVIDRGPTVPGREFDVTKPLADRMGLHGTQEIQWGFAR